MLHPSVTEKKISLSKMRKESEQHLTLEQQQCRIKLNRSILDICFVRIIETRLLFIPEHINTPLITLRVRVRELLSLNIESQQ